MVGGVLHAHSRTNAPTQRTPCVRACVCMRADVHHASVVPAGSMLALT